MIVLAYANGDRKTLKGLLSREVFEGFESAIAEREGPWRDDEVDLRRDRKSRNYPCLAKDNEEQVTVRILIQLITATYDKAVP